MTDVFDIPPEDPIITEALLRHGANIDATDDFGMTALGWAVVLRRTKTVRLLLEHGADPNANVIRGNFMTIVKSERRSKLVLDNCVREPLLLNAFRSRYFQSNEPTIARLLIEHGAFVNATDNVGRSALWAASHAHDRNAVSVLLKRGAKENARDHEWDTRMFIP